MDFINNYYNLFPISYPNDCDTICEPRKKENKTKVPTRIQRRLFLISPHNEFEIQI